MPIARSDSARQTRSFELPTREMDNANSSLFDDQFQATRTRQKLVSEQQVDGVAQVRRPDADAKAKSNEKPGAAAAENVRGQAVVRKDGTRYRWQGQVDGDYRSSGKNSLFAKVPQPRHSRVKGGLTSDKYLMYRYGTFAVLVPPAKIAGLFERWNDRIGLDDQLRQALYGVASDQDVFDALQQFFEDDHGRLETWEFGGHYDADNVVISIAPQEGGPYPNVTDSQNTILHQLLHYVSDKEDALIENRDRGGADADDHPAIEAFEDRFMILRRIRGGIFPLDPKADPNVFGHPNWGEIFTDFTKGSLKNRMDELVRRKDWRAMQEFVQSEQFYKSYVGEKMLGVLSSNEVNRQLSEQEKQESGGYIYTPEQVQDVAALHAFNATLIRESVDLAVALARKRREPVDQVYRSAVFQVAFQEFVAQLSDAMTREPTSSVRQIAQMIMDKVVAKPS